MQEVFRKIESEQGDREVVRYIAGEDLVRISNRKLWQDVKTVAAALHHLGLTDAHIGVCGSNNYRWMVSFFAVIASGNVVVPLDANLKGEDLAARLEQADICAVFSDRSAEALDIPMVSMEEVQNQISSQRMDITMDTTEEAVSLQGECSASDAILLPFSASAYTEICDTWCPNPRGPHDMACIIFTSGTTARPKAVMVSHRGMIASCCNDIVGDTFEVQLAVLPFHHLVGYNCPLNTICLGGIVCLEENLQYMMRDMELLKVDYMFAVPSMLRVFAKRLARTPEGDLYGNAIGWNIHMFGSGGASFEPDVMDVFEAHGIRVLQGYGASEAGGMGLTMVMKADGGDSIGRAFPGLEVKIEDHELLLRSDSIMLGYYKDPEATAEALTDGWYHTGDVCSMDEDGYLHLHGRKKNLIILSNGENISPEALETKLIACEDMAEIMVYEKSDSLACRIRANAPADGETLEDVQRRVRTYMDDYNQEAPGYQKIRFIEFTEEPFRRNALGKLVRG